MDPIISHIIVGISCFILGIFVYRNNRKGFDPFAAKVDEGYDRLEKLLEEKAVIAKKQL
jgi:hypothetical protein